MARAAALLSMQIDIVGDPTAANDFVEESLVHLARCGVVSERLPGAPVIDLPGCAGPALRVHLDAEANGEGAITSVPALLLRLVELGVIADSGARDEELLMKRLVDLGYL